MKSVVQKHRLGCGAACTAALLNISYDKVLTLFNEGRERAKKIGFYCQDIVEVINHQKLQFTYEKFSPKYRVRLFSHNTIVYITNKRKYPAGHYLLRVGEVWMDSWINYPESNRIAGFRKRLPGKPEYIIFSKAG